jgi:hypothetical protein
VLNRHSSLSIERKCKLTTIDGLRKLAELNLCPKCFQKYKMLIEPTVSNYLIAPLQEWRRAEMYITQVTMRMAGAYTSDISVIPSTTDSEDMGDFSNLVNEKTYRKVKRWSFKNKIDYLYEKGFLDEASYSFLIHAKNIRNRIHDEFAQFSKNDLMMLERAQVLASQFFYVTITSNDAKISESIKENAELIAKELLNNFNLKLITYKK